MLCFVTRKPVLSSSTAQRTIHTYRTCAFSYSHACLSSRNRLIAQQTHNHRKRCFASSPDAAGLSADENSTYQKAIQEYQQDGVTILRKCLDDDAIKLIERGVEVCMDNPGPQSELLDGFYNDLNRWRHVPQWTQLIQDSQLAHIASLLMKSPRAMFYHDHYLAKEAGSQRITPWHMDQPYYPVVGSQVISMWIPLDYVAKSTAVQFVKGSHLWGTQYIPRKFETLANYPLKELSDTELMNRGERSETEFVEYYKDLPDIDKMIEEGKAEVISYEMEPGDVLFFHFSTLHGAPGNKQSHSRRALALRWFGDDNRFTYRPWEISPEGLTGNLKPGDDMECEDFPCLYRTV